MHHWAQSSIRAPLPYIMVDNRWSGGFISNFGVSESIDGARLLFSEQMTLVKLNRNHNPPELQMEQTCLEALRTEFLGQ
jgi:hypothetical protein